jgi:hypothetical protein
MIMDWLNVFDAAGTTGTAGQPNIPLAGLGMYAASNLGNGGAMAPGTFYSSNIIDVSQIASSKSGLGRDIGVGEELELVVTLTQALIGLATSTFQVLLQAAPDNGSGSPGTFYTIAQSPAYAVGTTGISGEIFRTKIPASLSSQSPKFYQLAYVVGTANVATSASNGAILAAIVLDRTSLGPLGGYQSGYSNQYL